MRHLDRYIFSQILGPFAFFLVVFTGVIWLTQSLRVIDTVVNNGQSALVFLEFSALLLPTVLAIVTPISAFAATLYAINRLYSESEIVVMFASGLSRLGLARPVFLFGLASLAATAALTVYLMPNSAREMRDRVAELRGDVANALIFEGRFLHPGGGLTIYVRDSSGAGEMGGVFVHDTRDPAGVVTYTAERAVLARTEEGPRLVMFDGGAQRLSRENGDFSLLRFDSFVYDLSRFAEEDAGRRRKPSEYFVTDLVNPSEEMLIHYNRGRYVAEGHEQLSAPLYALALPLLAVAAVIGASFQRRGYIVRIGVAVAAGLVVRMIGLAAKAAVSGAPVLWPAMYAPPLLAIGASWFILRYGLPRRRSVRPGGDGDEARAT